MAERICSKCMDAFVRAHNARGRADGPPGHGFDNSDDSLRREAQRVVQERETLGLAGLVRGLDSVVINTEGPRQQGAVEELLAYTGFGFDAAFEEAQAATCVLKAADSASLLVRARKTPSPFEDGSALPKTRELPQTRLETLVFETSDLDRYVAIQRERGVNFLAETRVRGDGYSFIQTVPSTFSGMSFGFIEWLGAGRDYAAPGSTPWDWRPRQAQYPFLNNVKELDHAAARVEARDRDPAIIEFLHLTDYRFDFSIYVEALNSITNVARLPGTTFAAVFTSGIHPYVDDETSGPTEKFVHNYGKRVHHIAFRTEHIETTVAGLKGAGLEFLLDLVGSEAEGLQQIFSVPSVNTLLVTEYIHRYGDFQGFFTQSNVTLLTAATDRQ